MQNESLASEVAALAAVASQLAAYKDAFARAQRTLLDAANKLRELRPVFGDQHVNTVIDECNLAAMNPGVVEHAPEEPEQVDREQLARAHAKIDQLHKELAELSGVAPVTYQTGELAVTMPTAIERHDQIIDLARAIGVTSGTWTLPELADQARVRETRAEAIGSVGAGRLSVELHALTDLLALARSIGAEVGTFTVHELARIAGNLHAASYTEHSSALNKIHALLHNMPEPSGPMPAGSEASIAATVERVQILVGALRMIIDALVGGAA